MQWSDSLLVSAELDLPKGHQCDWYQAQPRYRVTQAHLNVCEASHGAIPRGLLQTTLRCSPKNGEFAAPVVAALCICGKAARFQYRNQACHRVMVLDPELGPIPFFDACVEAARYPNWDRACHYAVVLDPELGSNHFWQGRCQPPGCHLWRSYKIQGSSLPICSISCSARP